MAIIKDESGKVLTESDEIKNRWKNYCENLYASQEKTKDTPETFIPCGDDEPDILLSEVQEAIKKLKNQKALGIDGIPGELLKQADDSVAIVLQKLCNSVWKSKIWPEDWKKSVFLIHPRKKMLVNVKNKTKQNKNKNKNVPLL